MINEESLHSRRDASGKRVTEGMVVCWNCHTLQRSRNTYCIECGMRLDHGKQNDSSGIDEWTEDDSWKSGVLVNKKTAVDDDKGRIHLEEGLSDIENKRGYNILNVLISTIAIISIVSMAWFWVIPSINHKRTNSVTYTSTDNVKADQEEEDNSEKSEWRVRKGDEKRPDLTSVTAFTLVEASSSLADGVDKTTYEPSNVIDGDTVSVWIEDSGSGGQGEWIRLSSDKQRAIRGVSIIAGNPKTREVYQKNNRPKVITVSLSDGYSVKTTLEDLCGQWQSVLFDGEHVTNSITITIESVREGTMMRNASFAEIKEF